MINKEILDNVYWCVEKKVHQRTIGGDRGGPSYKRSKDTMAQAENEDGYDCKGFRKNKGKQTERHDSGLKL